MHGVTHGPVALLSLHPAILQVAGRVFAVPNPALLRSLKLGDRVAVAWHEAGEVLLAVSITPEA